MRRFDFRFPSRRMILLGTVAALMATHTASAQAAMPYLTNDSTSGVVGPISTDSGFGLPSECADYKGGATIRLVNHTPFTWTASGQYSGSVDSRSGQDCWPGVLPARTIVQPGQDTLYIAGAPAKTVLAFSYVGADNMTHYIESFYDGAHLSSQPDVKHFNEPGHTAAPGLSGEVSNGGFTITLTTQQQEINIDGDKDPSRADAASTLFLDPAATNKRFILDNNPVTFSRSEPRRVSSKIYNESGNPVSLSMGSQATETETVSLGWSAALEVGFSVASLVDMFVTATVAGGQSWTTSVTTGTSMSISIDKGRVGWIESRTNDATVRGTLRFEIYNVTYNITNVSVKEPRVAANQQPAAINSPHTEAIFDD